MPTQDTDQPTPEPAAQPIPIGTPPGGGSWQWDAANTAWVPAQPEATAP